MFKMKKNTIFTFLFENYFIYVNFHNVVIVVAPVVVVAVVVTRVQGLSTNFQIGFGSFVEKPLGPYTTLDQDLRNNSCPYSSVPCEPTYSYRHAISLTNNSKQFEVRISTIHDYPPMQLVCTNTQNTLHWYIIVTNVDHYCFG